MVLVLPLCFAHIRGIWFQNRRGSILAPRLYSPILDCLLFLAIGAIAGINFQGCLPGQQLDCRLQSSWQRLWSAHDGTSIERIQDYLNCCGFNSVKHEAWPDEQCAVTHGRESSCRGTWSAHMKLCAGLVFGVNIATAILKVCLVVVTQYQSADPAGAVVHSDLVLFCP
jgi:hypothetical protein